MKKRMRVAILLAVGAVVLVACGGSKPKAIAPEPPPPPVAPIAEPIDPPPPRPRTLYERLGGQDAITAIVDELTKNMATDARLSKLLTKTKGERLAHLKLLLSDQFCELAGGPCRYTGKDMKTAHKGMGISDGQFDAFIEDLNLALDANKVGETEKSDLFAAVGKIKEDVVEKKGKK